MFENKCVNWIWEKTEKYSSILKIFTTPYLIYLNEITCNMIYIEIEIDMIFIFIFHIFFYFSKSLKS
jgi:hypothetical protein